MSKTLWVLGVVVLVVVALYIGRCTSPRPIDRSSYIDSLDDRLQQSLIIQRVLELRADSAYQAGKAAQVVKIKYRIIYRKDTAANHRLTNKDSVIKARLEVPGDSSTFTNTMANKVLDLGSQVLLLHSAATQDSVTIAAFNQAYLTLDSANLQCEVSLENRQLVVADLTREVKRQKRLKWGGVVLGVLVALLL